MFSLNLGISHKVQNVREVCTQQMLGKGKAVPLQAWSGPEGSRKLRFPDFMKVSQKVEL